MQSFVWILAMQTLLLADPFYYGNKGLGEIKLFAIMHKKANINGEWVRLNANFTHANGNFRLIGIQATCVVVENIQSKAQQSICQSKPRFIKEK